MAIDGPGRPKVEWFFAGIGGVLLAIAVGVVGWASVEALLPGSPLRSLAALLGGARPPGAVVASVTLADATPKACRVRGRGSKGKISLAGDAHDSPSLRLDDGRTRRLRADAPIALGTEGAVFTGYPLSQPIHAISSRVRLSGKSLHDVTCLPPGSAATVVACEGADGALGPCPGADVVVLTPEAPVRYFHERRARAAALLALGGALAVLGALGVYTSRSSDRSFFLVLPGRQRSGLSVAVTVFGGLAGFVLACVGIGAGPAVSLAGLSLLAGVSVHGLGRRLRALRETRTILTQTRTTLVREAARAPGDAPTVELAVRVAPTAEIFEVPPHGRVAFARLTLTESRKRGSRATLVDYLHATRAPDLLVEDASGRGVIAMKGVTPDGATVLQSSVGPAEVDALAALFGVAPERARPESKQASAAIEVLRPGDPLLVYARRTGTARAAGAGEDYRGPAEVGRFEPLFPDAVVVGDEAALLREVAFDLRALVPALSAVVAIAALVGGAAAWLSGLGP